MHVYRMTCCRLVCKRRLLLWRNLINSYCCFLELWDSDFGGRLCIVFRQSVSAGVRRSTGWQWWINFREISFKLSCNHRRSQEFEEVEFIRLHVTDKVFVWRVNLIKHASELSSQFTLIPNLAPIILGRRSYVAWFDNHLIKSTLIH